MEFEEKNEKSIEKVVQDGLESTTMDLTVDYAELALDSFLDNDAIKEIPIVKTILGLVKGGIKIKEIHFAKKLLTFLKEFHSAKLKDSVKIEFQNKFKENKKYRNSVVEQIMILNERILEIEKSKILANLFASHINDKFDWPSFLSLSYCAERLNLTAIDFLNEMAEEKEPFHKGYSHIDDNVAFLISAGIAQQWGTHLYITAHGQYLHFYGIKGNIDYEFPKQEENK
ncbi:hypothetical protein [Polaribacter sp. AHE13PA]|uniref:hypothetical protein n=1 Tax=Polaribacter sp. AHE13PA TaxID=2745562 RepID=UPI001C4F8C79|nr:hypothetical protein [Polaribacter sp. AHE13PA]QXP68496.1 hypothetical protein H0I28_08415 [Polaribacter sp. AHE13PA]